MSKLFGCLAALAVLSATPALADSCIRQNDIRNWSSINDKTLVLENYRHEKWKVSLIGTCSGFNFDEKLLIQSRGSSGISCIQTGDTVVTHDPGMQGRCMITGVERYVPPAKQAKPDEKTGSTP